MKIINSIKKEYQSKNKIVLVFYTILNLLVIVFLTKSVIEDDTRDIVACIMTLILFLVPSIIHIKLKIFFAPLLEIMLYILVFSAEILGELLSFYIKIKIFDTILHLLYGFVMAGIGLSLIDILNKKNKEKLDLTNKFIILFSVCYSMFTGVTWEIYEYGIDKIFNQDMQKDTIVTEISSVKLNDKEETKPKTVEIESLLINDVDYIEKYGGYIDIGLNDTMKDIIVNLLGALIFSIFANYYLNKKSKFASNFMLEKKYN